MGFANFFAWGLPAGVPAPEFSLAAVDKKRHALSQYRGKKVFVYFYPQAFTMGCTAQACSFGSDYSLFKQHGYVLLGISTDAASVLQAFADKYALPFPLLSDEGKKTCRAYEVLLPIGKANRVTFLVNELGIIEKVFHFLPWKSYARTLLKRAAL